MTTQIATHNPENSHIFELSLIKKLNTQLAASARKLFHYPLTDV